jgi:hypothetical protein
MDINIPKISIARSSKIYPNLDFWVENIPSGNPVAHAWIKVGFGKDFK